MKSVVFFDFFGVICSEIAPFWFRRHFDDKTADEIKADIVARADLGIISEEEMQREIAARTGVPADQIRPQWLELVNINGLLVDYIRSLRGKHQVYLLSNAIGPFLHKVLEDNDLYSLFDRVFISSEMGIAKPDVSFYERVLSETGAKAGDAVMIDDNAKNIAGAVEAGIDGIIFSDNEQMLAELNKYL